MMRSVLFRCVLVVATLAGSACGSTSGPGCTAVAVGLPLSVSASTAHYPFTISTSASCAWTARTDVSWADVSPGSGTGPIAVTLNVTSNDAKNSRTATVTINGQSYAVVQNIN